MFATKTEEGWSSFGCVKGASVVSTKLGRDFWEPKLMRPLPESFGAPSKDVED